jgi:hypothetical protein
MKAVWASLGRSWDRVWHAEGSTLSLGLFRLLFAFSLFQEVRTTRAKSLFAIEGGFHLPYRFVPDLIGPVTEATFHLLHVLQYPLIVLLGVGLLMRPAIVGLLVLQGYVFFSDALNYRNHPYFFLLVLVMLLCSPADESVSIKSLLRGDRRRESTFDALTGPLRPMTFQRMIMVQFSLVYFLSGLQKLNPSFLDGRLLAYVLERTAHTWGAWPVLPGGLWEGAAAIQFHDLVLHPVVIMAASLVTVALEFVLPFTLWFPRTRSISIVVGIGFHLAILVTMGITVFSYAMMACYLLFLDPETLPRLASTYLRRRPARGKIKPSPRPAR